MPVRSPSSTVRSPRATPERAIHVAVSRFLRHALPADATYTTFPLGGGGYARGQALKAMGTRAGWPDVQVLYDSRAFFVELKAENGRLSDVQIDTHRRIVAAGCPVLVARSVEEVDAGLRAWGVPLKAGVA